MPIIEKIKNAHRVDIIDTFGGWGVKINKTIYFDNKDEAIEYANDYNNQHNPVNKVPNWYIRAVYTGIV